MSEITQPPPDVPTQDPNSRVSRLNAASDQSTSNKQSAEQQTSKQSAEVEPEKQASHHDPAVTLASTLSKLDAGSHFQATVTGQDGDGRTVIQSELGTYLVDVDRSHLNEFQKIQKDELLELRVVTIDKEIKAEIIRNIEAGDAKQQIVTIPVTLTLTDLAHSQSQLFANTPPTDPNQLPLEDIRSQYNATTLYRAESIAREIGEKLDNLPLPTSAPNYTVYAPTSSAADQEVETNPRQVYSNVFIQEVSTSAHQPPGPDQVTTQNTTLQSILGTNISVEVIKTVPQTTIALPEGLPEAVRNEIRALTPLDNVSKGQLLNINISAIAVPEAREPKQISPQIQTVNNPNQISEGTTQNSIVQNTPSTQADQLAPTTETTNPTTQSSDATSPQPVISGIIVDALQTNIGTAINLTEQKKSAPQFLYGQNVTGADGIANPASDVKNYYLATPSTVLKFSSSNPMVAGTIVSFTIDQNTPPNRTSEQSQSGTQNPAAVGKGATEASTTNLKPNETAIISNEQPSTSTTTPNSIAPMLADRIDQFFPQELDQLTEDWSSISLAMSALTTTGSSSMAAIMASRIPNMHSPEQLTSTMFLFLSALKSATPARTWLGSDVSARLRQLGASRSIDRIDHDFSRIARLGTEVSIGDWRPLLIPAQNGPDFLAIPMIIKHIGDDKQDGEQSDQQEENRDQNSTRFILEVNFSEFGKVIIDGLLKNSRLDIILKSNELIPYAVKTKLSRKFNDAIDSVKFEGELVIIDSAPTEISVKKIIETMSHNARIEKNI